MSDESTIDTADELLDEIARRTSDLGSVARAVDTLATREFDFSKSEWARATGRNPSSVSRTTNRAEEDLNDSINIIEADWKWEEPRTDALSTPEGEDFELGMEAPTIWASIDSNKGHIAVALRRTGKFEAEMETIGWRHNTVRFHDGPATIGVEEEQSFVDLAEDQLENPSKRIRALCDHIDGE